MTNKLSEKKGGGLIYSPSMMEYNGSTGVFLDAYTAAGQQVMGVFRFRRTSFTGAGVERVYDLHDGSLGRRISALVYSSDHATTALRNKLLIQSTNSAGTNLCRLVTLGDVVDGQLHTIFYAFDAATGVATFIDNGADAIDTGHPNYIAPTTGTLTTGSHDFRIGTDATSNYFGGSVGYVIHDEQYLTNWQDFMDASGRPKYINETLWTEFGGTQPKHFNPHGDMQNNRGSEGNSSRSGGIITTDDGTGPHPMIGLPTTANASIGVNGSVSGYAPGMMLYDGSTGYHGFSSYTAVGNKVTMVGRFKRAAFTTGTEAIARAKAGFPYSRMYAFLEPSNHADSDQQSRMVFNVLNSSGTIICYLVSTSVLADDNVHTFLISFDGDTGAATFIVDGQDEDNVSATNRVAPTTGTLATTGCLFSVGSADDNTAVNPFGGEIGFIGHGEVYLTNWQDFMEADGRPKQLDESGWAEWGGQPRFWNPHGEMRDNRGSLGDMTKNGGVVVGDGGSTPTFPIAAALATSSDIVSGKTAWVDGVEVLGTDPGLKKGLVGWWPLNESSGDRYDIVGGIQMLDLDTVPSYSDGTFGTVIDFQGVAASAIQVDSALCRWLPYNSDMSIAGWVRFDSLATGKDQCVMSRADNGASSNATIDYQLILTDSDDKLGFYVCSGSNVYNATWDTALAIDTWYFVYAYYSALNSQVGISINDGTIVTGAVTGVMNTGGDRVKFGRRSFNATWDAYMDGKASRFGLWSRLLEAYEVTRLLGRLDYADL